MDYRISQHAEDELIIRNIPRSLLDSVLLTPDQIVRNSGVPAVYQSRVQPFGPNQKSMLLRIVVDEHRSPAVVITVYLTSRIEKYWQP